MFIIRYIMDINKDNCLIKLLLETKTKPNFSKYTLEKLTHMYLEFIENKNNFSNKLFLEKEYSEKTIDILNSICYDFESVENQKIQNLILTNELAYEYEKKKILIDYLCGLWKKIPIIDGYGEITDCMICLNHITNHDNICFQCEHKTHSTCFFNYLFTNLKNNSDNYTIHNLIKLFKCPNCRNGLTDTINEYINEYTNENVNINMNENLNLNIEEQYGDEFNNFILQEYNLFADNIGEQMLNGFFRTSNNSNIIIDNQDDYNSSTSSSYSSYSSDYSSGYNNDVESISNTDDDNN